MYMDSIYYIVFWVASVAAIGTGIWEFIKWKQSRPKVSIDITSQTYEEGSNKTTYAIVTVTNAGHVPVNLIRMGFRYGRGGRIAFTWQPIMEGSFVTTANFDFSRMGPSAPGWLFVNESVPLGFSESALRQQIREHNQSTNVEAVYFTDERGRFFDCAIPDTIQRILYP
jgi:hypothetical protein